jgi:hypothetical protein
VKAGDANAGFGSAVLFDEDALAYRVPVGFVHPREHLDVRATAKGTLDDVPLLGVLLGRKNLAIHLRPRGTFSPAAAGRTIRIAWSVVFTGSPL